VLGIDFWEFVVIGVVALVVLGPERLPRVARTAGHLLGRFQRYVAEVKADINREMELAELKKLQSSVEDAARSVEESVKTGMQNAEKEFREAETALTQAGEELKKTTDELQKISADVVPKPHMGMGLGYLAETASAADSAAPNAQPAGPGQVSPAAEGEEVPSPQLELSLDPAARKQA
jgi:sec-independent protein translocase protein TatB